MCTNKPPCLNFHLRVLAPQFFHSPNLAFTLTSRNRNPLIPLPLRSGEAKQQQKCCSTPPSRSRLSWSLFGGLAQYTRSRYMTPRLYLHLDLSIEQRHIDNPPRHSCLPMVYFLSFYVGILLDWVAFCLYFWLGDS
jgi:hypothetical protein